MHMELVGHSITLISFAITIVVGGISLLRSIYFFFKALSNANTEVAENNDFIAFNFTNAIWVPNGLTVQGREYRAKAIRSLGVFIILSSVTAVLATFTGGT